MRTRVPVLVFRSGPHKIGVQSELSPHKYTNTNTHAHTRTHTHTNIVFNKTSCQKCDSFQSRCAIQYQDTILDTVKVYWEPSSHSFHKEHK